MGTALVNCTAVALCSAGRNGRIQLSLGEEVRWGWILEWGREGGDVILLVFLVSFDRKKLQEWGFQALVLHGREHENLGANGLTSV